MHIIESIHNFILLQIIKMKTLENNEVLNGLLKKVNDDKTKNELNETLGEKVYNLKYFYWYLSKKINSVKNNEDFKETPFWKDYYNLFDRIYHKWEDKISEAEVRRIIKELNECLEKKREILREPFTQDIPYFRASYSDKEYYLDKIEDRSLSVDEYEKMQNQIDQYGSILSRSNRRWREFGGWYWDIILSLTNWKIYDVEWEWEKVLEEDYSSSRYYSSRSGASAAWNIYAGKWSLVYMPSSRMDVTYPTLYFKDINGLNMTMCTSRWVVDETLPTIIKSWKVNLWVDAVFLSQKNHLEQWNARDLINTIETKGENLKDWPVYNYKIKYFDENLEKKEKIFTFKTNMNPKDINFRLIWRESFWIERWFDVEETWSFIDKMVWIKKCNWKYVRLWQFWLVKEVFDMHPSSNMDKEYYDEIEIWDRNEIVHKKVEIEPMFADYNTVKKFNWWIIWDKLAYKNVKNKHNLYNYDYETICSEHGMKFNEELKNDDVYHLVYEDDIARYNQIFKGELKLNMEFEYYVPKTIFEKFSSEYWKDFLSKKLKEKVGKGIDVYSLSEIMQKIL